MTEDADVIIDAPRLRLRPLRRRDAAAVFGLFGDPQVTRYYDLQTLANEAAALAWIEQMIERAASGLGQRWAITERDGDDALIGTCGLAWRVPNRSAVLGYDLLPAYWGCGYVSEAVAALLDHAFARCQPFEINRIEALTYPENAASMRVLEKLGFVREGLLRQWGYWKDDFHDLVSFSLLRADRQVAEVSAGATSPGRLNRRQQARC